MYQKNIYSIREDEHKKMLFFSGRTTNKKGVNKLSKKTIFCSMIKKNDLKRNKREIN